MAEVKRFSCRERFRGKMVENCGGMDSEALFFSTEEIPEQGDIIRCLS